MRFSIVTIVFRDLPGLKRTRESVDRQSLGDWEWIVVDGGSKDGTAEYLGSLPTDRRRWVSEVDRGIYDAMNKGTRMAAGEFIVYLNAGDSFCDEKVLEDVSRTLAESQQADICYAGAYWVFQDGSRRYRAPRRMERAIRHGLPGMHQATFYRRDALDDPPYSLRYPVSSDYFISARLFMRQCTACYLDRPVADFTVGGNSMQKANASLRECWGIQRDVLGLGAAPRLLSATRRYVSFRVLMWMHWIRPGTGKSQ